MIIQEVINHLEEFAPLAYAEDFDNVGLLVGNKNNKFDAWYLDGFDPNKNLSMWSPEIFKNIHLEVMFFNIIYSFINFIFFQIKHVFNSEFFYRK